MINLRVNFKSRYKIWEAARQKMGRVSLPFRITIRCNHGIKGGKGDEPDQYAASGKAPAFLHPRPSAQHHHEHDGGKTAGAAGCFRAAAADRQPVPAGVQPGGLDDRGPAAGRQRPGGGGRHRIHLSSCSSPSSTASAAAAASSRPSISAPKTTAWSARPSPTRPIS